jgi:hypothetical protein
VNRPEEELAVAHLVRESNGLAPFRSFLDSYRRHPAGVPHELVLIFKGFASTEEIDPYATLARDLMVRSVIVNDHSYDLGAYFDAAAQLPHARFCFLNSFSAVAADGWLELLSAALNQPGVGLAGASGSWASVASRVHWELWRRGAYAEIFEDRQTFPECLLDTFADFDPNPRRSARMHRWLTLARIMTGYARFPAHHVRTNAFVLSRETMARLHAPIPRDKIDAHLLECGRHSITRQVEAMGMQVLVAARDGSYCPPPEWAESRTFWQGDQENLLIADNQSENYRRAEPGVRLSLARWAWGAAADP